MLSSHTGEATHRLLLRGSARVRRRYRGPGPAAAERVGFSTPAGLHRRPWLARLRRALENDLFELHYQPIVSLSEGRITHWEALVRLADEPHGRLVAPASFLPAAERYGLVRDIDRLVLRRVAELLANGGERTPTVTVNVSALSATDGGMLMEVERHIRTLGFDPSRLVLEVTETAAISDMRRARDFCEHVQRLGCAVALDDFGSGFGSFQYLKHLPFDYLKIDGGFIRGLPSSPTDQLVVKALVGVVRGMGRRTIAEFVGDTATLRMLHDYGVDYAQGYAVGRPGARAPVAA
ncbi:MAG TPA: EAL domain-containing protein [Solirubrobacteraceae bacterium]|nr:EAL domain-containing protein [Solirubrobacteraceae bacterium]